MSAIREAIALELAEARAAAEEALGRVQQLEELDAQAAQLDGGEAPVAAPPSAAGPAAPRRKTPTPAGRRSVPARRSTPKETPLKPAGQAHTANGASAGGRPSAVKADDIVENVKAAMKRLGPASPNAIGLHLGYQKSTSGMVAVREVIAKLLAAGEVKVDGQVRGRPAYALADVITSRPVERAIPAGVPRPSMTRPAQRHPIDKLVDEIVEQLEVDGGRVARQDLKDRVGDPGFEDFELALDRAVTLKKIEKTKVGGVTGYELAK